jgi:hypothetical protein
MKRVVLLSALLIAIAVPARTQSSFWQLFSAPNVDVIYKIHFDPRGDMFASTSIGIFRSTDLGRTWVSASSGLPQFFEVQQFASPAVDVLLAAIPNAQGGSPGMYRTTNAGTNWIASGLSGRFTARVVSQTSQLLFAGGSSSPIWRSTNGGTAWDSVFATQQVNALVINRIGNSVFAATPPFGVRRSTDNGLTWPAANGNLLDSNAVGVMAVDSAGLVYAGLTFGTQFPGRVYRSTDNGQRWAVAGSVGTEMRDLLANRAGHLFALPIGRGVYRSLDNGATWSGLNTLFADSGSVSCATISHGGFVYLGTFNAKFYRSAGPTAVPNAPYLLSPRNGVTGLGQLVTFSWTRYDSGLVHHLQVATSPTFVATSLVVNESTITTNTRTLNLPTGQLLYWRVRVSNALGWGPFSPAFTIGTAPLAPSLISPPDSSTNQPTTLTLSWSSLGSGITYHLQVSTNVNFTTPVVNDSTLTATQRQVGPLANSTTYFWRVRAASSPGGPGPFSAARRFTTVANLPQLTISPRTFSFDTLFVGSRDSVVITLTNIGSADLRIDSVHIVGINRNEFQIIGSRGPFVIPPQNSQAVKVECAPQDTGSKSAALRVVSNAPSSPDSARLTALVLPYPGRPQLTISPRSYSFDTLFAGSRDYVVITLTNTGSADLRIDSVHIVGINRNEFQIIGSRGPFVIPPQNSQPVEVEFAPQDTGSKSAALRVVSNAPSSPDSARFTALVLPSPVRVNVRQAFVGDSLRLSFTFQQTFRPIIYYFALRNGGQTNYSYFIIDTLGIPRDSLLFSVPPQLVNIRGIEYYLVALDSNGIILTYPSGDFANNPARIRVSVRSLAAPIVLQPRQYRMVSIPLEIAQPGFVSVLEDDFGSYDPQRWRIFRWRDSAYAEFQQIPNPFFTPGTAFWLITRMGGTFDVENALSVLSGQPLPVVLRPGWNQIANPFAYPVQWITIQNSTVVRGPIGYDGRQFVPNVSVLQPWEGYFVYNDSSTAVTLVVPPFEADTGDSPLSNSMPASSSYTIQLSATTEALSDAYNFIGFRADAADGDDRTDIPEPVPPGDYLQLSCVENGRVYACNFKPLAGEGQQWLLQVSSSLPRQHVRVTLHEEGERPAGFKLFVLDEDERVAVPLTGMTFSIQLNDARSPRTLRLIIGTDEFAERVRNGVSLTPLEYALEQNYPNPFNPTTTIRYSLKQQSSVQVELFNVLGQRIRTLVRDQQPAGVYRVTWDGTDDAGVQVSSGMYIVRLRAGEFTASKKVMLLR